MITCKKPSFAISLLVLALTLPFAGCYKKHKTAEKEYTVKKEYRDIPAEHSRYKGEKHRDEMKGKARHVKEKVQRKACNMCGGKTQEGKCVVCGK